MITRLGALSLGDFVPGLSVATAQLSALLAPVLAQKAQLAATLNISIVLPNPSTYVAQLESAIANVGAMLTALPAASAGVHAGLSAQVATLTALISLAESVRAELLGAMGAGGFYGYAYAGAPGTLGGELQTALATDIPPATPGTLRALVLATMSPGAWASAGILLRTS